MICIKMSTPPPDSASGLLSDNGILRSMANHSVSIAPFRQDNLNGSSYDVTLGPYFFRENSNEGFYNPYSDDAGSRGWLGPFTARRMADLDWTPDETDHVNAKDELVIVLRPGETILTHTCEFIGSSNPVVPVLFPRSSLERCFVHVQGGLGHSGYLNRWALRITNTSKQLKIPLIVGRKIAQIAFYQTEGVVQAPYGSSETDKYQAGVTLPQVAQTWKPQDLLPKLHLEPPAQGKLSMASDPVPGAPFSPYFMRTPTPMAPPVAAPVQQQQQQRQQAQYYQQQQQPSMTNPNAAAAAASSLQQQQYRQPIQRQPVRRDVNGELVTPMMPPELQPMETRNIRGPPIAAGAYNPDLI